MCRVTVCSNLRADKRSEVARDIDADIPKMISYAVPKTINHTRAITYPEETRSRPEAFGEALDRARVERP